MEVSVSCIFFFYISDKYRLFIAVKMVRSHILLAESPNVLFVTRLCGPLDDDDDIYVDDDDIC